MLQIHPNARTTPVTRAEIARSSEPSGTLAKRYGVSAETIRKMAQARCFRVPGPLRPTSSPALEGDGGRESGGLRRPAEHELPAR